MSRASNFTCHRLPVILAALGSAVTACVHLPPPRHARTPQPPPSVQLAAVQYSPIPPVPLSVTNLETHPSYSVERIELAAAASHVWTNRSIQLDYYRPAGIHHAAVILVLPIIGGGYPLERMFCATFARHGFAAVLVRRDRLKTLDRLEEINGMLLQAAIDARQALDWIETRSELDPQRLGLFGISMGGIRAAFLTPLEPRIHASVIGLAGGDLPHILAYSCEPGLSRRRRTYLTSHRVSLEQFREGLKPLMTTDPLTVAPAVDPAKILLVLGSCDTAVPSKKGFELRRAMGKPETIVLPTGHYTALLFVPYIKAACVRFFHQKLGPDSGP